MKFKQIILDDDTKLMTDESIDKILSADMEVLSGYLYAPLLSIQLIENNHSYQKYAALTEFGMFDLFIFQQQLSDRFKFYEEHEHLKLFPIIYEYICIRQPANKRNIQIMLCEPCENVVTPNYERMILELTQICYYLHRNLLHVQSFLDSIITSNSKYYLNYFRIIRQQQSSDHFLKKYLRLLQQLSITQHQRYYDKVYLIADQAYQWNIAEKDLAELSVQCSDWLIFSIYMNLEYIMDIVVTYRTHKVVKKGRIAELNGIVNLIDYGLQIQFENGKSTRQYSLINKAQLKAEYFEPFKVYKLLKDNLLTVLKQPNTMNKNYSYIIIQNTVSKVECVEFFIIYLKYIELKIHKITVKPSQIELILANDKYVNIIFYCDYVIRQDELAVIINKAELVDCEFELNGSSVTDKIFILLSNIQKARCIKKISVRGCHELTDYGLATFFESNLSDNLLELDVSDTKISDIVVESLVANLHSLQKLRINDCKNIIQPITVNENPSKLKHLQILHSNVTLNYSHLHHKLTVLKTSIEFPVQNLKLLNKMPLKELKIKLVEHKKQKIMNFVMSNLYTTSYTKQFCEGAPGANLVKLDISGSNIRFKSIKGIFQVKTLIEVKMNRCDNLGQEFEPINKDVENIEFKDSLINARHIKILLERTKIIRYLDIRCHSLSRHETIQLFETLSRQVNQLHIEQGQYAYQILSFINKGSPKSINKLTITFEGNQEDITDKMLSIVYQVLYSNKVVNFSISNEIMQKKLANKIQVLKPNARVTINYEQVDTILKTSQPVEIEKLKFNQCQNIKDFRFHCLTKALGQELLTVDLSNNRFLSIRAVQILNIYAYNKIQSFNCQNCLFTLDQIVETLAKWPNLQQVNDGYFQSRWTGKNFQTKSQSYLKFFMRLNKVKSLSLKLYKIKETQLLFSILYYIINHHRLSLTSFKINLDKIDVETDQQPTQFFEALLTTITLTNLQILIENCRIKHPFNNLNRLQLKRLEFRLPKQIVVAKIEHLRELKLHVGRDICQ